MTQQICRSKQSIVGPDDVVNQAAEMAQSLQRLGNGAPCTSLTCEINLKLNIKSILILWQSANLVMWHFWGGLRKAILRDRSLDFILITFILPMWYFQMADSSISQGTYLSYRNGLKSFCFQFHETSSRFPHNTCSCGDKYPWTTTELIKFRREKMLFWTTDSTDHKGELFRTE